MNPQTVDLLAPFDPTGFATLSGAELMQLVSGLAPQAYVGWNVVTDDDINGNPSVPNANVTAKWKYYNWVRRASNGGVLLYVWNPAAATDATFLNWQVANVSSIVAGSITGNQLADLTITGAKIALSTITWDKMTNGAAAGGCLTGTFPNPALGNRVVGSGNIALGAIVGGDPATISNLAAQTVEGRNITQVDAKGIIDASVMSIAQAGGGLNPVGGTGKLQIPAGAVYGHLLRIANGGATWESVFNSFVKDFSGDILTGNALKKPRVNAGATALEMVGAPFNGISMVTGASTALSAFTTGLTANDKFTLAHGLGVVPSYVRAVLLCITNDGTYTAADEVSIEAALSSDTTDFAVKAPFVVVADAINVTVPYYFVAGNGGVRLPKKDGTGVATITPANWKVKVYAAF